MGLKVTTSFDISPEWVDEFVQLYVLVEGDPDDYIRFWGDDIVNALQSFIDLALDGTLYSESQDRLINYFDVVVKKYRKQQKSEV